MTHKASSSCANLANLPFDIQNPAYSMSDGHSLSPSSSVPDLGIKFTDDLSWSKHISEIARSASSTAAWVLNVFKSREQHVMITIYKSLIRSRLEYCSPLWNPSRIGDIRILEGVQRSFTAKIHKLSDSSYWDRLTALKILSLQRRRERFIIFHMWKILNGKAPNDLSFTFVKCDDRIKCPLKPLPRSQARIQTLFEDSFVVTGPKLWNLLPKQLTFIDTFTAFKTALDRFLELIPDRPPVEGYHSSNNNSLLHILFRQR